MMKTLVICGKYPLPEDHGSPMRTMNFVRFFRKFGRVDLAYSGPPAGESEGNGIFSNAYRLKQNEALPGDFADRLNRLISIYNMPLPVRPFDRESEELLLSIVSTEDYDCILARYVVNSSILFRLPEKYRKRTIIDFDDIVSGSLYDSKFGSVQGLHKRIFARLNRNFLMNYEQKCLQFGASLFCSEKDKAHFTSGRNGKGGMHVVPNIYASKSFEGFDFGTGSRNGNILLFVGSLGYGPNTRSLKWFIETILPPFKECYADGQLLVVGRTPGEETRRLCAETPGVELYADVPDIKKYYRRCRAVVVPLLAGGGTRIKILEAALAERPVLSTPVGAEGLNFQNGRDILLFDEATDFIAAYSKIGEESEYGAVVTNAKEIVKASYSAGTFDRSMEIVLCGLARGADSARETKSTI